MANDKLEDRIYVRVCEDGPYLVADTTLDGVGDGLDQTEIVEVAEYQRVRVFKVRRSCHTIVVPEGGAA